SLLGQVSSELDGFALVAQYLLLGARRPDRQVLLMFPAGAGGPLRQTPHAVLHSEHLPDAVFFEIVPQCRLLERLFAGIAEISQISIHWNDLLGRDRVQRRELAVKCNVGPRLDGPASRARFLAAANPLFELASLLEPLFRFLQELSLAFLAQVDQRLGRFR